ncbi:unnamed protein product [Arabidopsis arenosa]|uniref:Agenet domain-containing protein n=1 Tax=Arabidopsis arenosa TaxID=38785 RepID=A0A8S1ZCQ4_ARAAE|nr:unnamed protein product [Arabidopsis arenosa]
MEQMLFIRKDDRVEVFFEEEELKGSYYRAILEDNPTKSGHKKLKVRYLTLLNGDRSAPLTEFVDQSLIRPVPSEDVNDGVVFEEGLMVDAYLKYGWWTGVVVKTMEDEKFLVYFDCPPDIIQLERKILRVHFDWTGFKWIRPVNKELVKSVVFSSGTMVELRFDFAWLPAIVIKELENEKRFIVKYWNNSYSCSGESNIIIVESIRLRPMQPSFSVGNYELLDHVEAFSGFEWREGVVRGIVFEGRYMVSFGTTKEASQFSHLDLRPPMEWEDGVWHKRTKPKGQKEISLDGKGNKPVALDTRNVQTKELPGNEMANDVVNEKESGSHITLGMTATMNKTQGKISPEPMKNQIGSRNEPTREKIPEKHYSKVYTRKRKRGQLEHNSDLNKTVLSSDRTPNVVKNVGSNVEETQAKDTEMVLPFAKKSPCWKIYESTEVFKRVPQSPHFSPLLKSKEDFREGYALGLMVIYSGLLEKFKDLETDVPVSQLHSLKDSFSELEKYGFSVTTALSRIDKLLALKDRQLDILEELKGFDKEMTDESSSNRKAKQEFDKIERKILELHRQEAALKKQKEAATEQKDAAYKKICQMESCVKDLDVELEGVEFEFETILSAPW